MANTRTSAASNNRARPTAQKRSGTTRAKRQPGSDAARGQSRRRGTRETLPPVPVGRKDAPSAETRPTSRLARVTETVEGAGNGIKSAGAAIGGTVAQHPLPAALIGAGIAWLVMGGRARGLTEKAARAMEESELMERAGETLDRMTNKLSGAAGVVREALLSGMASIGESVGGAAESVREGAAHLTASAQEGARTVGTRLREGTALVGDATRRGYTASKEGVAAAWERHPLTAGLVVLAAGVGVGMMLPGTQRERDMMGRRSDAVSRRVRGAGREIVQRGRRVAASVAGAVRQEAEGEGLGAGEVVRKVRRIAEHVQEAAVSAASRERLDPVSVLREAE